MKQLSMDAFLSYRFLSNLQFSPDGRQAALVVSQADAEENSYRANIWLYRGGSFLQLTALDRERSFVWEDDTHILFPAVRSAAEKKRAEAGEVFTVFYRIGTEGGEALPAFEVPFAAAGIRAAGPGRWLLTGTVEAAEPDAYLLTGEDRAAYLQRRKDEAVCEVLEEIPFYANGGGWTAGRRTALFLLGTADGSVRRLSPADCSVGDVEVLGDTVFFTALQHSGRNSYYDGDIYRVSLPDGEAVQLTHGEKSFSGLALLDGRLLTAAAEKTSFRLPANEDFYLVDPQTGALTLLAENDDTIGNLTGSDCRYGPVRSLKSAGGRLYLVKTIGGSAGLYAMAADGTVSPVLEQAGSVDDFDVTEDGQILLTGLYGSRLQEVYALEDGTLRQRSHFNDAVLKDVYVAGYNRLTVQSEGREIEGWVLLPKDFDETRTYPAILDIHGGPGTAYGPVFYHEMQVWASCGYFVFFCNPVGSAGRGAAFADISGQYGGADYRCIMDFTDAVLARWPQIDPARLGCTGGSYGGFMSNWILGHTDRFAAIATQRSISNWISFYGTSDIGIDFAPSNLAADIHTPAGLQAMWDQSPLKYADNMRTPTLIIHSTEDYRCPLEQGLQLFTALQDRGVPARMCCFPGENHELSRAGRPQQRLRRLQEITQWMDRWLDVGGAQRR